MSRNNYAFSVLQATAAVASLAIIMWSLGFPTLQFAEAANVTSFSSTLSDSAPNVASDHTISFATPTGVAITEDIVLTFDPAFDLTGVTLADIDLEVATVDQTLAGAAAPGVWGVTIGASTITFTSDDSTVAAAATVVIEIGENADSGVNQITNPVTAGQSYPINVTAGPDDSGETRVAIVEAVVVTATVDTIFEFTVAGLPAATTVGTLNPAQTGPTTATAVPFGELVGGVASTAAQSLEVSTNASNGFIVTVTADQQLTSSNGADIDGFIDGSFTTTPTPFTGPGETLALENTYGHWALSSDDTTLEAGLTDIYSGGDDFVSASTTPVEVFRHDGPADGTVPGEGSANVVYQVEISDFQEAADDYIATLTYVATPVF